MDILIKGLALPKKGHCTIVAVFSDGSVDYRDREEMAFHRTTAVALPSHGDLIDRGLVQEVLAQLLPLVITNELTDKEIGLVHRTVGAIAEMINEQEVVVEATE